MRFAKINSHVQVFVKTTVNRKKKKNGFIIVLAGSFRQSVGCRESEREKRWIERWGKVRLKHSTL